MGYHIIGGNKYEKIIAIGIVILIEVVVILITIIDAIITLITLDLAVMDLTTALVVIIG